MKEFLGVSTACLLGSLISVGGHFVVAGNFSVENLVAAMVYSPLVAWLVCRKSGMEK